LDAVRGAVFFAAATGEETFSLFDVSFGEEVEAESAEIGGFEGLWLQRSVKPA
jgi:hypothetical protein